MKTLRILILFNLVLNYIVCYSQNTRMNRDVEEIIALGKDSIVQLALKSINDNELDMTYTKARKEDFKKIKILTNGKDILVSLANPIKYLPQKTVFIFDFWVELLGKTISTNIASNPANYEQNIPDHNIPFFKETKETKARMQFIFDAINRSDEIGSIDDGSSFEDDMIIRDRENYYDIIVYSESQTSFYKIEKTSGKIYDATHKHLVSDPFENQNKYEEVHWDKQ